MHSFTKLDLQLRHFYRPLLLIFWRVIQFNSLAKLQAIQHQRYRLVTRLGVCDIINSLYSYMFFFQWFKIDNEFEILTSDTSFSLQAANLSDSGMYVCQASSEIGIMQRNITVTVRLPTPPTTASPTTQPTTTVIQVIRNNKDFFYLLCCYINPLFFLHRVPQMMVNKILNYFSPRLICTYPDSHSMNES